MSSEAGIQLSVSPMNLLQRIFRPAKAVQVRRPDYVERRNGSVLQIWGEEGYWHVVDPEVADFLREVEQPRLLRSVFNEHPDWRPHERSLARHVRKMGRCFRRIAAQAEESRRPLENVTINLVTACNLHCRTCYIAENTRTSAMLDVERTIRFLETLRPSFSSQASLSLLGGEPFLHLDALEGLGRWAREHKLPCNVSTNGTVVSERLLHTLVDTGLRVQVSLDGASAAVNDQIRGPGSFKTATATIRQLVARQIPTTLCMVCCRENVAQIPAYFSLARQLNVQEVRFIPLKKLGNSQTSQIAPAPVADIVSAVAGELDRDPSLRPMCRTDIYSIFKTMLRETSRRWTCGTGTQTLLLQADGTVYPCLNTVMPDLVLGRMDDGAASVLRRGRAFAERLSLDSAAHFCGACVFKRWCLGVCPGETLQQTQARSLGPHWDCVDVQRTLIEVMWRLAREQDLSNQPEPVARSIV